jgi:HPt (histidine-containing phosphotransfer) domain-containing protein
MNVGFDDILIKPFKRPDIEKMLRIWPPGKALSAFTVPPEQEAVGGGSSETAPDTQVQKRIFDRDEVLETFMDNTGMIRSLLSGFLERTAGQISAAIPQSMAAGDWDTARREAHTIKGSALTMAAGELGEIAARLELAFKNIDNAEMAAALPLLGAAFTRIEAEARSYLAGPGGEA